MSLMCVTRLCSVSTKHTSESGFIQQLALKTVLESVISRISPTTCFLKLVYLVIVKTHICFI